MANPLPTSDAFFDSDELMSWLLLNPEMCDLDTQLHMGQFPDDIYDSNHLNVSNVTDVNSNIVESNHVPDVAIKAESGTKRTSSSAKVTKLKNDKATTSTAAAKLSKIGKKRQRESVEDIEARVNELRSENADLQAHLMNVTQRTTEVQKQRAQMEKLMLQKLGEIGNDEDADQSELAKVVKQYTDIYADYGKCRQREVSFHLNQLEKLLCPTKTTKLSLWALQQDKSFFQTSKSPMFGIISKELELTPEQTEKIQERREKTTSLLGQLKESLNLIATLKTAIEKKHACYDAICGRVQDAATPKQIVLFLKWISAHADELAKYIPSFSRNVHHMPNVEFVEGVTSTSSSSSSSSSAPLSGSSNNSTNGYHSTVAR